MSSKVILVVKTQNPQYNHTDERPEFCYRIISVEDKDKYKEFSTFKYVYGWKKPDTYDLDEAFYKASILQRASSITERIELIEYNTTH